MFKPFHLDFNSHRSPVMGKGGMVSTSQPLATAAGLEILASGGNAADAALAAGAVLNVTEPTSTGIGGDMFALFFDSKTKNVSALNGTGRSPASLTLDKAQATAKNGSLPALHPYTITVPGACAGWCDLIEKHGSLSLSKILAPAIKLAEEGFPVSPLISHYWQAGAQKVLTKSLNGNEMMIDGRGPNPGEIFRNPGLAKTLKAVAEGGKKAYYKGPIAEAIVDVIQKAGGCMSLDDLATHTSTWETPSSTTYQGYRVYECPPNGQGITALLALNILEGFDMKSLHPLCEDRLHLQIETLRLAFADTRWYVTDPTFSKIPLAQLLSKKYAAERRKLINPKKTSIDPKHGSPVNSSDTIYLSVMDKYGNACSFINSNYMGFGTGIVPKGCGFTLQNRGHNFSLDPKHPNVLAPKKRTYHTIIPAMATRESDGSLFASFGVMGGFMQPQGHVQVFLALVDGLDPQSTVDLPRFCINLEEAGGGVSMEKGISSEAIAQLQKRGHLIKMLEGYERSTFGRSQILLRDSKTSVITAGSDPRADGCAMTLA